MKRAAQALLIAVGAVVVYAVAHLALIEIGREIVVLHRWEADGSTWPARLWIVDEGEVAWLHHGYAESEWIRRLESDPVVRLERDGSEQRLRARPDPGAHDRVHVLLREKYGVADRWVRFISGGIEACPAMPVRLERAD